MDVLPSRRHLPRLTLGVVVLLSLGSSGMLAASEPQLVSRRRIMPPAELARGTFKPLDQIVVEPQIKEPSLPEDCAAKLFSAPTPVSSKNLGRQAWHESMYAWTPPEYFYRPLYFEQLPLERYGHSAGPVLQPVVSGAHFFSDVLLLPYHWLTDSPYQWVSPLGFDRPGSEAEPIRQRLVTLPGHHPRRAVVARPPLVGQE